ncbi:MAG: ChbG/HpnK family deacetylase, partial [Anaeromyxobacteraceae bacterium]
AELGLPVRAIEPSMRDALRRRGIFTVDRFLGDAALRPAWTEARVVAAVATLGEGTTELMAHPGYRPSHAPTSFGVEREDELAALCAPSVRRAVEAGGVRLCDYAGVRAYC